MENETKKSDWQEREVGALWKKDGANQKYLTGHIKDKDGNSQQVVIFSNKQKTKDTQPDFRVYKSVPKEDRQQVSTQDESTESTESTDSDVL